MKLEELTLEQLLEKRASIIASCSGWLSCQDGSYEMALHYAGLERVDERIAELRRQQQL